MPPKIYDFSIFFEAYCNDGSGLSERNATVSSEAGNGTWGFLGAVNTINLH